MSEPWPDANSSNEGTTQQPTPPHSEQKGQREDEDTAAWIRYRVEFRDVVTDELVAHRIGKNPNDVDDSSDEMDADLHPAFEIIKTVKTQAQMENQDSDDKTVPVLAATAPSFAVKIYSSAIINAIQSVVQYYPSQNLTGDAILIKWPYAILCHHYDELAEFRDHCKTKDPSELCEREKKAPTHIQLLLDWLDENIMSQVREEQERNRRGAYTWEWSWVGRRPGKTFLCTFNGTEEVRALIIHSVQGGSFSKPSQEWNVTYWHLEFDGTYLGRKTFTADAVMFDGERTYDSQNCPVNVSEDADVESLDEQLQVLVRHGEKYWEAMKKQSRWYKGTSATFPHNEAYYADNFDKVPGLMDYEGCRDWISNCTCLTCQVRNQGRSRELTPRFQKYNYIFPTDDLTWHQKILCPPQVPGFVFRTRAWELLHVDKLSAPLFNTNMIDHLVMEPKQLGRIKALAMAYCRINNKGEKIQQSAWSADFVRGKGQGLIFLLHGKPGVGKTCTAECIAEFTQSPLMVLTSSDIGTNPKEVELNLTREFKKAKSWEAVLLIDEADVFMEQRSTKDLQRNSLVAGFLRALEFYDGILFLTTNRVGAFDDAFISRIHVQLYYPDFTDEQRQKIWQTFVAKLHKERGSVMRLNIDAKEYLRSSDLKSVKWNGREIRNAFQTVVSLAEYDNEKDEEGKVLVTDNHLRAVVELSKDFKDYLNKLHKKDEAARAAIRHDRLDDYER